MCLKAFQAVRCVIPYTVTVPQALEQFVWPRGICFVESRVEGLVPSAVILVHQHVLKDLKRIPQEQETAGNVTTPKTTSRAGGIAPAYVVCVACAHDVPRSQIHPFRSAPFWSSSLAGSPNAWLLCYRAGEATERLSLSPEVETFGRQFLIENRKSH